jgi:hypothetical protein
MLVFFQIAPVRHGDGVRMNDAGGIWSVNCAKTLHGINDILIQVVMNVVWLVLLCGISYVVM